jgi:hypothetical protein
MSDKQQRLQKIYNTIVDKVIMFDKQRPRTDWRFGVELDADIDPYDHRVQEAVTYILSHYRLRDYYTDCIVGTKTSDGVKKHIIVVKSRKVIAGSWHLNMRKVATDCSEWKQDYLV